MSWFWGACRPLNPNQYEARSLPLSEISHLLQQAETDYYTSRPVDFTSTGQQLYNWLDGSDRWLKETISQHKGTVALAISTTENLAHLPWEVLHDGIGFLVERLSPAVVFVRWLPDVKTTDIDPENRPLQVLFMACSPLNTSPVLDFEKEEARILATTARQPLVLTVAVCCGNCAMCIGDTADDSRTATCNRAFCYYPVFRYYRKSESR